VEDTKTTTKRNRVRMQMTMKTSWNGADDVNAMSARSMVAVIATRLNNGKKWWWRTTYNNNNHIYNTKKIMLKEVLWLNDLQGDAYRIRRRKRRRSSDPTDFWIYMLCPVKFFSSFFAIHISY
jgi:hypothetical protein